MIESYEFLLTGIKTEDKMIFVGSGVSSLINPVVESILRLPENQNRKQVILFAPDYPLFHSAVEIAGGIPIIVSATRENDYLPTIQQIAHAITNQTSAILFSNPNNPTGKCFPETWVEQLLSLAHRDNFFIVSDEVYSHMFYGTKQFLNIATLNKGYANYVKLFGLSKDRPGMTGLRTGYCIGDKRLLDHIYEIQMVRNFSGNILSDFIFLVDLAMRHFELSKKKLPFLSVFSEEDIREYRTVTSQNHSYLKESRDMVVAQLEANRHIIDIIVPDAGNSVFFRYHKNLPATELLQEFLEKGLATYPTDAFLMNPMREGSWIRVCLTRNIEYLNSALAKI